MNEYCFCQEIEVGKEHLLMCNDVLDKHGKVMDGHELELCVERDDEGNYFQTIHYFNGVEVTSTIRETMRFCYHCGRPLQNNFKQVKLGK